MNQYENIDELIAKFLADEASAEEKDFVNKWIHESESNHFYYADAKVIFEIARKPFPNDEMEISYAWKKLNDDLSTDVKVRGDRNSKVRKLMTSFYARAAIFICIIGIPYLLFNHLVPKEKVVTSSAGSASITQLLPDGTFIILSPQSSISYTSIYNHENREIKLKGEAYFKVHHNSDLPFVVNSEGTFTKDVGTAFKISSRPGDSTVTVHVQEGEALFYTSQNPGVTLMANEMGIYSQASKAFKKFTRNAQVKSKTKLHFEKKNLKSVVDSLNIVFNSQILLSCKELESLELTATFNETSVERVIEIIAETFHLSVTRTNQFISLDSPLCKKGL